MRPSPRSCRHPLHTRLSSSVSCSTYFVVLPLWSRFVWWPTSPFHFSTAWRWHQVRGFIFLLFSRTGGSIIVRRLHQTQLAFMETFCRANIHIEYKHTRLWVCNSNRRKVETCAICPRWTPLLHRSIKGQMKEKFNLVSPMLQHQQTNSPLGLWGSGGSGPSTSTTSPHSVSVSLGKTSGPKMLLMVSAVPRCYCCV